MMSRRNPARFTVLNYHVALAVAVMRDENGVDIFDKRFLSDFWHGRVRGAD